MEPKRQDQKELEFANDMMQSLARQVTEKAGQLAKTEAQLMQVTREVETIRQQLMKLQADNVAELKQVNKE